MSNFLDICEKAIYGPIMSEKDFDMKVFMPKIKELVDLMVEAVIGETGYPDPPPEGWRARLEVVARREWQMYGRHPWVLQVISTMRLPMGPNMTRDVEWKLRAVDDLSPDPEIRLGLVMLVSAFVQGAGLLLGVEKTAADRGEADLREWWEAREPEFGKRIEAVGSTSLTRLMSEMRNALDLNAWFEFGLQRTLDGIEAFASRTDSPSTAL